jgi:signal transduction histidine kinase
MRLRPPSPAAVDVGLTALALAAQSAPFLLTGRTGGGPWTAAEYAPVLLAVLPVLARRRAPVTCLVLSALGVVAYAVLGRDGPEQPIWFSALICMYTVAEQSPSGLRIAALLTSIVGVTVVGGVFGSPVTWVREVVLWGAAYALGRAAQLRRAYTELAADRAAERAATRERARIARDMHDVLAHSVTLMVVQAEAGPVVVRSDPDRAEAVFDAVADAGRDALAQLRRILGLLADGPADPTLDDVPALVAGLGARASLTSVGTPRPVPAPVGTAAYRIVQEALTNVVKHAGPARARITLDWTGPDLVVTVVDDGPGPGPGGGTVRGRGLIGITERAAACGGAASYGPGDQGFRVEARLPT